jgi:Tol biopolymer transport system component
MDAKTWAAVKDLLADVASLPLREREKRIREQCHDPELQAELLRLAADPAVPSDLLARPALPSGTRLGVYVVDALLDRGGMGEVYRARDTKLGRDVALKVLPSAFAADPERLARLEREARLLASLNHPNIAHVYGLEESNDVSAVAMELVEGETLAARIARGPIPIQDALPIARQMCEALEAAHDHGIIHRDLKPANAKLRSDGIVKVLDFGLAKALDANPSLAPAGVSAAPTTTSPAMTALGVILGTAAYMAPEQARGMVLDERADIWAFGCVLFEMLTGRLAFSGTDVLSTLASVLTTEPNWGALPSKTPPNIQRLLHRCLEKDLRRRLQAVGDARVEIEDALSGAAEAPPLAHGERGSRWREALAWSIVAVLGAAVLGAALFLTTRPRPATPGVTRLEIRMPPGVILNSGLALSPNGRQVAFVGTYGGGRQVYVRELDQLEASPLRSTATSVLACFFSPEGRELGFSTLDTLLKRVTLSNGETHFVAREVDGSQYGGGSWGRDGQLTFIRAGELWRVPHTGGTPERLTNLDSQKGEVLHRWPTPVGEGQVILFEVQTQRGESHIEAVSAATRKRHTLVESGSHPVYASSGHLLFLRGTDLFATPLDADRVMTTAPAPAVRVLQDVGDWFSVSNTGSLLYAEPDSRRFVWVSRDGKSEDPIGEAGSGYWFAALSPNGQHVAFYKQGVGGVWDLDVVRGGSPRRLTAGSYPLWTRDGKHVIVATSDGVKVVDKDTGQAVQSVPGSSRDDALTDVTREGLVAYMRQSPDTRGDIYLRYLDGQVPQQPPLQTPAYEGGAKFSPPDGRWLAYVSDESGPTKSIYAISYPGFAQKKLVSTQGNCTEPHWSPNGRELFFRCGDRMMAVQVSNDPDRPFSQPVPLWEHSYPRAESLAAYDVASDGRFLMIREEPGSRRLIVVENWIEELKARLSAGK